MANRRDKLLADIAVYCRQHSVSSMTFSLLATGDRYYTTRLDRRDPCVSVRDAERRLRPILAGPWPPAESPPAAPPAHAHGVV